LDHGEHDLQVLADAVHSKVDKIRVCIGEWEVKLKELQKLEEQMTVLKTSLQVDRQDDLIDGIEDHAQKCMEQVLKWKDYMIEQVRENYKIIQFAPEYAEEVSQMVHGLQDTIDISRDLLAATEHFPSQLDELISLQYDLDAIAQKDEVDAKELHDILSDECQNACTFIPAAVPTNFGQLDTDFEHAMQDEQCDATTPCMAVISSKYYAIAHPTESGKLADAIDIYEFPGTLKRTLRDHVYPVFDMSPTPDGKLAVLSLGGSSQDCTVKFFDPETGYVSCVSGSVKPISLSSTQQNECVILRPSQTDCVFRVPLTHQYWSLCPPS
jgi:hypothetical protein